MYDYAPRKIVFTKGSASIRDKVKGEVPGPIENLTVGTQAEIPELKTPLLLAEKVFDGWTDDTETPLWRAGDKVSITAEIPTTYNLKPKWKDAPTAVLRYDTNGRSGWETGPDGASYVTAKTQKFDGIYDDGKFDKPVIQTATPKKTGYTFAGWSREKDGEVVYTAGQVVDDLTEGEERTIYAKWEPIKYRITFHKNCPEDEEIEGSVPDDITNLTIGQTVDLPISDVNLKRVGKVFKGWAKTAGGSLISSNKLTMGAADQELYAYWATASKFTLTYNLNGGKYNSSTSNWTQTVFNDGLSTLDILDRVPTKANYEFGGWSTVKDGEKVYDPAQKGVTLNASTTIYAKWQKQKTKIIFRDEDTPRIVPGYEVGLPDPVEERRAPQ